MPNKGEVSYDQRVFKVRSVRDHFPKNILCEGIVRSLKGAVANLAQYLGPQAAVNNIVGKLNFVYGMVTPYRCSHTVILQTSARQGRMSVLIFNQVKENPSSHLKGASNQDE